MTRNLSAPRQRWAVSRIQRPGWALAGLAGGMLLLAACATAPEDRYFRVDPALPAPTAEAPLSVTLGVARVTAPEPYRQERIIYRTSPHEVQLYGSDRWESSPVEMVGQALLDRLRIVDISNNLGDAKSMATHPCTTTHRSMPEAERLEIGLTEGWVRMSVGLEVNQRKLPSL